MCACESACDFVETLFRSNFAGSFENAVSTRATRFAAIVAIVVTRGVGDVRLGVCLFGQFLSHLCMRMCVRVVCSDMFVIVLFLLQYSLCLLLLLFV